MIIARYVAIRCASERTSLVTTGPWLGQKRYVLDAARVAVRAFEGSVAAARHPLRLGRLLAYRSARTGGKRQPQNQVRSNPLHASRPIVSTYGIDAHSNTTHEKKTVWASVRAGASVVAGACPPTAHPLRLHQMLTLRLATLKRGRRCRLVCLARCPVDDYRGRRMPFQDHKVVHTGLELMIRVRDTGGDCATSHRERGRPSSSGSRRCPLSGTRQPDAGVNCRDRPTAGWLIEAAL
jgi:hypothetical protein